MRPGLITVLSLSCVVVACSSPPGEVFYAAMPYVGAKDASPPDVIVPSMTPLPDAPAPLNDAREVTIVLPDAGLVDDASTLDAPLVDATNNEIVGARDSGVSQDDASKGDGPLPLTNCVSVDAGRGCQLGGQWRCDNAPPDYCYSSGLYPACSSIPKDCYQEGKHGYFCCGWSPSGDAGST